MLALLVLCSCQKPDQNEAGAKQQVAEVPPRQVKWTKLHDGSLVATYRTDFPDDPAVKRCWKVDSQYDCLLVTGDETAPSGWWAWRQPSTELTILEDGPVHGGYNCYGGGKRNEGVTIGEVIGTGSPVIANQYVRPPAHQPWSREYVEATVGPNGVNTYFDCPALDRFITRYGVEALHSNRRLPRLF